MISFSCQPYLIKVTLGNPLLLTLLSNCSNMVRYMYPFCIIRSYMVRYMFPGYLMRPYMVQYMYPYCLIPPVWCDVCTLTV